MDRDTVHQLLEDFKIEGFHCGEPSDILLQFGSHGLGIVESAAIELLCCILKNRLFDRDETGVFLLNHAFNLSVGAQHFQRRRISPIFGPIIFQ